MANFFILLPFVAALLSLPHVLVNFLFSLQYNSSRPREEWEMWHPTLIAEALFAIANIFSSLRLISLFTANSHLGPLQISLGRMLLDILKFLFIYCLVRSFPSACVRQSIQQSVRHARLENNFFCAR